MARIVRGMFACSVVFLVALFSCNSLWRLKCDCFGGKSRGLTSREKVKDVLQGKMLWKSGFVDMNGGAVRLAGRRMCNERMLFQNGMSGYASEWSKHGDDARARAEDEIAAFDESLKQLGIPFLFVLVPLKMDLAGELVPQGFPAYNPNGMGSQIAATVSERGVRTLDMTSLLAATPDDVTRNYFRTDHHWRYRTALHAACLVANELSEILSVPDLRDHPRLQEGNWRWITLPRSFLGSCGRRTGRLFAGVDDFEYALPKFDVTIDRSIKSKGVRVRGDFRKAEIVPSMVEVKAKPAANRYTAYTGTDVDVQRHVNCGAAVPIRVMLVKDSFGNPVAAFWATVFKEVIQVDPRKLPKGTTALDLARRYRPDVVVEMVNPGFLSAWGLGIQYADLR